MNVISFSKWTKSRTCLKYLPLNINQLKFVSLLSCLWILPNSLTLLKIKTRSFSIIWNSLQYKDFFLNKLQKSYWSVVIFKRNIYQCVLRYLGYSEFLERNGLVHSTIEKNLNVQKVAVFLNKLCNIVLCPLTLIGIFYFHKPLIYWRT